MSDEVIRAIGAAAVATALLRLLIGESFNSLIVPTWIGGSLGAWYYINRIEKE